MTQSKHTQGQCSVTYNVNGRPTILGDDGINLLSDDRLSSEVRANAERLAHYWNCHDELLEALEFCVNFGRDMADAIDDTLLKQAVLNDVAKAMVVIAKARGEG